MTQITVKRTRKRFSQIIAGVLAVVLCLTATGCSGSDQVVSDVSKDKVVVSVVECQENEASSSMPDADASIFDPTNYSSWDEYIAATKDAWVAVCKACNFKYPSIMYVQMYWEGGLRYNNGELKFGGSLSEQNHALFGIKQAGENQDEWPYWTAGVGGGHSDGGSARAYETFKDSIYDWLDWICRYDGNGTSTANGKTYSSYGAGANDGTDGANGLDILLQMGYCPNSYAQSAYSAYRSALSDASVLDEMDKECSSASGDPIPPSQTTVSANTTGSSGSAVSSSSSSSSSSVSTDVVGDDVPEQIWNYFKAEGFSDAACAGILGNVQQESSFDPAADGAAFGLFQCEKSTGNAGGLQAFADAQGKDVTDVGVQCAYVILALESDFENYTGHGEHTYSTGAKAWWPEAMTLDDFKQLDDVDLATEIFERVHERASKPAMENRKAYANEWYAKFAGTSATASTETAENCEDDDGDQKYGNAGMAEGEKYHQGQGTHYCDENKDFDSGAGRSACGATSFTIGVNMLLGKVHEYCGVEVWHEMDSDSTTIGWGSGKAAKWLEEKGLSDEIEIVSDSSGAISSADDLRKYLDDGCVCVISSRATSTSKYPFRRANGETYTTNGHYILFYKYSGDTFYADDPSRADTSLGAGCQYESDYFEGWLAGNPNGNGCVIMKRK